MNSSPYPENHPFSANYVGNILFDARTLAQQNKRQVLVQPPIRSQDSIAIHDEGKIARLKRGRAI
jgi:hypothetical protein